jgi:DoxX-like protein
MDLLHLPPFFPVLLDLGYPAYLASILGVAKLLATAVILAPRLPRLKEWAYAGIVINMVGAAASHLAVRDGLDNLIAPLSFAAIALTSWALRPPSRRLDPPAPPGDRHERA